MVHVFTELGILDDTWFDFDTFDSLVVLRMCSFVPWLCMNFEVFLCVCVGEDQNIEQW